MQVSVEELGDIERRMTVQIPAEQIEQEVLNRLVSLSRKMKLHGFRPGKVPVKVAKRMYGTQVRQEVITDLVKSSFQDALTQEQLRPAGSPKVELKNLKDGTDLEYSATFEVLPEFEPAGIEGLKVERPVAQVTEGDIDAMLQTLRKQRIIWNAVERNAQQGDRVTISFEGKLNGEDFPNNKGENLPVVLGTGSLFEGFEEQLIGLKAGDQTEFDVTFPEDYSVKDLVGRTVHFAVEVDAVAEPSLPEVDEEFVAAFGVKEGGIEGLRKVIRENMERELDSAIRTLVKRQIIEGLLNANDIPLPQSLVNEEIERLAQQLNFPTGAEGEQGAAQAKAALFDREARRRVALALLISRLAMANNIKVDSSRVRDKVESIAAVYEDPEKVIKWYYQHPQALEAVQTLVLEEQVVDWLLGRAELTDKPSSFDAIVKLKQADPFPLPTESIQ